MYSRKNLSALVVVGIFALASCTNSLDSILSASDSQNVNAESASASYANESSVIATNVIGGVSSTTYAGSRGSSEPVFGLGDRDDRLKCATVTINRTGTKAAPAGTITITFDPACNDKEGVKRSGTIVINYFGRRWIPGSYFSVHTNFSRNDTQIKGIDSILTQLSVDSIHLEFQSILTGGIITFGDGKTVTREHNLIREWFRASLPSNDEWHTLTGGTAAGMTKGGKTYSMQITKDLIDKVSCRNEKVFIPVSGTKVITVGTEQYTIDFGDGSCDNVITVILKGKAKQVTVNPEGD